MAADVLALGHLLRGEGIGMVTGAVANASLFQLVLNPESG
jgi:hypothetical protein